MTKVIVLFLLVFGFSFFAVPAQAEDEQLIAPERIIHACISDGALIHELNIDNQRPYGISGTAAGSCYTVPYPVAGQITGKNGNIISATTHATTTDINCCSFTAMWSFDKSTRTGSYNWQQDVGPHPNCGAAGGPVPVNLVACTAGAETNTGASAPQ